MPTLIASQTAVQEPTAKNPNFINSATAPHCIEVRQQALQQFIPLELERRPTVETAACGHYLHLADQTLRIWACKETGPLRPIRINGRLHWKTEDIRRLLGVSA